jgi:dTDP-4-amino-4,6-dideoxygalactose transaminase
MSKLAILGGEPVRRKMWPPWPHATPRDWDRLRDVLDTGNWGGYPFPNRYADEFATRFARYHGAEYGCTVVNGTLAITIALIGAGIRFGDEVIVPAYTWDGTAVAVLLAGGVPVFADIDPDTYCLDPDGARRAITLRTKAIVPVHLAMRFADMDALGEIAKQHGLAVIEDCAHAHGAQYRGRGAGSIGDAGAFSFQSSKIMTSGEGGIIITSRLDLFELVQSIVNCGRASVTDTFGRRLTGANYRITEFQAALLLGQLEFLPELAERRARNAEILRRELPGMVLPVQPAITREAIYHFILRYRPSRPGVSRDMFVAALDAEGVAADGRFYEPVYRSDLYKPTTDRFPQLEGRSQRPCPISERAAYDEAVWIPQFVLLGDEDDTADVVTAVTKVLDSLDELAAADPALARVKSMSRAERPHIEVNKNY